MKKYKVLIVHNYYQIPGGEDTVVKSEMDMLKDNGHEVLLYMRHNDEIKKLNRVVRILSSLSYIFSIKTFLEVRKIIKKNSIDIVHVHNTFPLISPSVYYAAFSCKVPVVQTIHNFRMLCPSATFTRNSRICEDCTKNGLGQALKYKCYRNSFSQTLAAVVILKIHRILGTYKRINGYIALTNFNKNKIKKLVKDDEKIFVKPNFSREEIQKPSYENYKNYFVYIGRLDKLKGINLLINSWRSISHDELYIIGDGPEKDNVAKLVKNNNITNIKLLGFMDRNEALNIVKQSKAIIVPSQWYEGFPMTIVEAYSMGVPVIGGNIGNLNSIIKDKFNGLIFKYDDSKELVSAVKKLETNENLISNLRKGAFKTYKDNYTEDKNYDLLYGIYNNLI